MKEAIQLFGYLILAMLGFILPIVAILLSVFREGILKLAAQYETEKVQSENNIKAQLKKMAKGKTTDESAIQRSLKELRFIKKTAEDKLSYLDPKKQVIRLFIPLVLAFLGVVLTLLLVETNIYYCFFLLISLVALTYTTAVLWNLIGIIIEVRKIIDTDRKATDTKIVELLSILGKKVGSITEQYFLKKSYISWENTDIKDESFTTTLGTNTKKEIKIGLDNIEPRMAKNVEIGFIFPTNFIIDKQSYYTITRDETRQIVRYTTDMVQGHTHHIFDTLVITPLEQGVHKIQAFVKAENIEATYRHFTIKVT